MEKVIAKKRYLRQFESDYDYEGTVVNRTLLS